MENMEGLKKFEIKPEPENIKERVLFECPEQIRGKVNWIELTAGDNSVEVKFYNPETSNKEAIIFMPGIPGDFTSFFESKHVPQILEQGYAVCSIRRNGVILSEKNSRLVNSDQRLLLAQQTKQGHIGEKDFYSINDWIKEIEIITKKLLPQYQKIYFLGHSFGGLEIYKALNNLRQQLPQNEFEKIAGVLTLSGSIGEVKEGDIIDPLTGMSIDHFQKYLEYLEKENIIALDSAKIVEQYKKINKELYDKISELSPSINATFVAAIGDEFVSVSSALDLREKLKFGRVLMDYRQKRRETRRQIHGYPCLKPQDIMCWLTHKTYSASARGLLSKYYFSEINRRKMEEYWKKHNK